MALLANDNQAVLTINFGSTSLKMALFLVQSGSIDDNPDWTASITWNDESTQTLTTSKANPSSNKSTCKNGPKECAQKILTGLWQGRDALLQSSEQIIAVGHRIVHGGIKYSKSTTINREVLADIHECIELAPLHQKSGIEGVELATKLLPSAQQIAVFDTAYFHDMPMSSQLYAVPYEWYEKHNIRRFGFHGISHKYCAERTIEVIGSRNEPVRIITCHLGGGSSITASHNTTALATTMGFTPLEGLVMTTRSGSVDPGLILHLLNQGTYSVAQLSDILNHASGLAGISGYSGDVRELFEQSLKGNTRCQLAIDIYADSIASHICSLLSVSQGIDAIVFTAGIGENSPEIRQAVCDRLAFLNVKIDTKLNETCVPDSEISAPGSTTRVFVIRSRENLAMARECLSSRK